MNGDTSNPRMSAAHEKGLQIAQCMSDDSDLSNRSTESNCLTTDWLSRHVAVGGCRDGSIHLFDARNDGRATRLRHPSAAAPVRAVDESRIVVAGLRSSLCMYDLRYAPPGRHSISPIPAASVPCVTYDSYHNEARLGLGFDVDTQLGLVAAVNDDGRLTINDIWTGEPYATRLARDRWQHPIKGILFSKMSTGSCAADISLVLYSADGAISEWRCL